MDYILLEHIYVEFRLGEKFSIDQWGSLFESDGQVFNIESVRNCVKSFLSSQTIGENKTELEMTEKDFSPVKDMPFKRISITFNVSINNKIPNFRNGGYSWKSFPKFPIITVNANGEDINELVHQCNKCVCHELIHSAEDTGLANNTGNRLGLIHLKNGYNDYVEVVKNDKITDDEVKSLFKMLYWTDFSERKAFFGTLYSELCKHKGEFYNSEDAYKVLHETEEWKGYLRWENTVEKLNSYLGDKKKEGYILSIYNNYCHKRIKYYSSFLQLINRRWRKIANAMREKAARILYRVYTETLGFGGTVDIDEY